MLLGLDGVVVQRARARQRGADLDGLGARHHRAMGGGLLRGGGDAMMDDVDDGRGSRELSGDAADAADGRLMALDDRPDDDDARDNDSAMAAEFAKLVDPPSGAGADASCLHALLALLDGGALLDDDPEARDISSFREDSMDWWKRESDPCHLI